MSIHYVITLVHGTWAPHAPWTYEDSLLCRTLRSELMAAGASVVEFTRAGWSGRNRHEERQVASLNVARHLEACTSKEEHAKHFVIAHSHGANVVLRAIRTSATLQSRIVGVV